MAGCSFLISWKTLLSYQEPGNLSYCSKESCNFLKSKMLLKAFGACHCTVTAEEVTLLIPLWIDPISITRKQKKLMFHQGGL